MPFVQVGTYPTRDFAIFVNLHVAMQDELYLSASPKLRTRGSDIWFLRILVNFIERARSDAVSIFLVPFLGSSRIVRRQVHPLDYTSATAAATEK